MTAKPRKEAAEAVRQLQQAMDLTRLRMRPEGAARLVEQVAIRPVADPLEKALDEALAVLRRAHDDAYMHGFERAALTFDGVIKTINAALAAYRGEGK